MSRCCYWSRVGVVCVDIVVLLLFWCDVVVALLLSLLTRLIAFRGLVDVVCVVVVCRFAAVSVWFWFLLLWCCCCYVVFVLLCALSVHLVELCWCCHVVIISMIV